MSTSGSANDVLLTRKEPRTKRTKRVQCKADEALSAPLDCAGRSR